MLVKFESVKDGEMLVNTEWVTTVFPVNLVKRGEIPSPKCCINLFDGEGSMSDCHEVYGTLDEVAAKMNGEAK